VLLNGAYGEEDRNLAAALCVSHSKLAASTFGVVRYNVKGSEETAALTEAQPLDKATLERLRV
jgi:hypothetical protein